MCLNVCFEAGGSLKFDSWTVYAVPQMDVCHAGYAAALAQSQTDPIRQVRATVAPSTGTLREILPLGPGRGVFSLTSPYHGCPGFFNRR